MRMLRIMATLVLAAGVAVAFTSGATAAEKRPKFVPIERQGLLILIRGALTALDQANKTGNYTLLRDLGGPSFQENNATRLGEVFAPLRQQKIDLSSVLILEPFVTLGPQIEANGLMRIGGSFPAIPRQINFEIAYQQVGPVWKLYGLAVTTSAAQPTPTTPHP
ncbi:hypothetical protein [Parvibaculum sp.]|uniref:hypothetical protein n=1 Tax=Parvibaculum sp. TaxID=2024848 RepID=UPI002B7E0313|nr:hypothetical protein [Parvibaculum sp.]HUD52697.1 hypothetical protein [Parvibaculum sp.]